MLKEMTKPLMLTQEQNAAKDAVVAWVNNKSKRFVLAGYAGTGKTTLAKRIGEVLGGTFCAYTGKAASVLQSKGIPASTIHSIMYDYKGTDKETGEMLWGLKNIGGNFLIVDEYSMISRQMIEDIESKFDKVLYLGDPMQLLPIGEKCQILEPDVLLKTIHRQAANNPILQWSMRIRNGEIPNTEMNIDDKFIVKKKHKITDEELKDADQIICGKNATRHEINDYMRELYGFSDISNIPVKGEKLVIRQNNNEEGFVNGEQFTCMRNANNLRNGLFDMYAFGKKRTFWGGDILGEDPKNFVYRRGIERVEYGYAITCHKSQGSEYKNVVVFNEGWGAQRINWLYTAITRATDKVILAI